MKIVRILIAVAISLTFLMMAIASPASAGYGTLSSGTCSEYNDVEFMTGYWYSAISSGCELFFLYEIYMDVTTGSNVPIYYADVYLSPEDDGDHVIEDTDQCCEIKFYDPHSNGASTVFTRYLPNQAAHYGDEHIITYGIGAGAGFTDPTGTVGAGADISITYQTVYWDTTVAPVVMGNSEFQIEADIDDKKDEARYFRAACTADRISWGYQAAYLYVEGDFEATGWWGTNTVISKTKLLGCYM